MFLEIKPREWSIILGFNGMESWIVKKVQVQLKITKVRLLLLWRIFRFKERFMIYLHYNSYITNLQFRSSETVYINVRFDNGRYSVCSRHSAVSLCSFLICHVGRLCLIFSFCIGREQMYGQALRFIISRACRVIYIYMYMWQRTFNNTVSLILYCLLDDKRLVGNSNDTRERTFPLTNNP